MTAALCQRYPEVFFPIKLNLEVAGVEVKIIHKTENVWIRDYFPISINNKLFRFQYKTIGYEDYPQLDVSNEPWTGVFNKPIYVNSIILDGGNIIHGFDRIIMTEKVIQDNGKGVVADLEKLLGTRAIIIPVEPGDNLGHSDGICKIIDVNHILINDYSQIAKRDKAFINYQKELEQILVSYGFWIYKIPNAYDQWQWSMTEKQFRQLFPSADDFNPGFGYYINFLKVADTILLPAMKIKEDAEAYQVVKKHYPECRVVMVDCSRLSMEGGLVNCISAGPYTV
jgi:agmatine/peptidylarginine deiminase